MQVMGRDEGLTYILLTPGYINEERVFGPVVQEGLQVSVIIAAHIKQWGEWGSSFWLQIYQCLDVVLAYS